MTKVLGGPSIQGPHLHHEDPESAVIILQQPCAGRQVVAILNNVSSRFASVAF